MLGLAVNALASFDVTAEAEGEVTDTDTDDGVL